MGARLLVPSRCLRIVDQHDGERVALIAAEIVPRV
jgi:hypothetical protein